MSVNGVTSTQAAAAYSYSYTESTKAVKEEASKAESTNAAADSGVIYEPSGEASEKVTKKTYTPDTNLINRLKADADVRTEQLRSLVEKMMLGQAKT